MNRDDPVKDEPASPPCSLAELDSALVDPAAAPPEGAEAVARWRKAERSRLRAARLALPVAARERIGAALATHLDAFLAGRGAAEGAVISGYWPIKGEPDLRGWMAALHARGFRMVLPVVEVPSTPLVFRAWTPGTRMVRGHWNIPVPPEEAERLRPDILLAPLVGWDSEGYRLGYGGGYFDRTLEMLGPGPLVIGVGLQAARLATIHPQPHDIRLSAIVTEAGLQVAP